MLIGNVCTQQVVCTHRNATVTEAAQLMRQSKIGCLPVLQQGKLVGIISEYDLLGIVEKL